MQFTALLMGVSLAVAQPKPSADEIRVLVEKLQSVDIEERDDAAKRLKVLGPLALPALQAAGTSDDAELKIRAMQIIAEMETEKRGPYAGAVGYFGFSGNMDTAIAIRTLVVKDGVAYAQAGGGIVFDSVPETEYEETLHKASAALKAIDEAEAGA